MTTTAVRATTGWTVDDSTFAARLALVRLRMGWNVKEAARECGLPAATWRLWEMEGTLPRRHVDVAKAISTRTGCDYLWLLVGPDGGDGGGGTPTREFTSGPRTQALYQHERPIAVAGDARRPVTRTRPRAIHNRHGSRPAGRALTALAA